MYHVNAQGVDECMINVHYYYYYYYYYYYIKAINNNVMHALQQNRKFTGTWSTEGTKMSRLPEVEEDGDIAGRSVTNGRGEVELRFLGCRLTY